MKYLLRKVVSDKVPEIEITAEEYAEFEKAHNILSNALAIEEKYEIVIANYLDFEKQILNTTTGHMVREHLDYSDFFEVRLGLNTFKATSEQPNGVFVSCVGVTRITSVNFPNFGYRFWPSKPLRNPLKTTLHNDRSVSDLPNSTNFLSHDADSVFADIGIVL